MRDPAKYVLIKSVFDLVNMTVTRPIFTLDGSEKSRRRMRRMCESRARVCLSAAHNNQYAQR